MAIPQLKLKQEYLIWAVLALSLALVAFFYFRAYSPLLKRMNDVSRQISRRQNDISQSRGYAEQEETVRREIALINRQIERYQKGLKQRPDIPKLLSELNKLSGEVGVKIASIKPGEAKTIPILETDQYFLEIPLEVDAKSGYHQFGLFVNLVENSSWFIRIEDITVKSSGGDDWIQDIHLGFNVYALGGQEQ